MLFKPGMFAWIAGSFLVACGGSGGSGSPGAGVEIGDPPAGEFVPADKVKLTKKYDDEGEDYHMAELTANGDQIVVNETPDSGILVNGKDITRDGAMGGEKRSKYPTDATQKSFIIYEQAATTYPSENGSPRSFAYFVHFPEAMKEIEYQPAAKDINKTYSDFGGDYFYWISEKSGNYEKFSNMDELQDGYTKDVGPITIQTKDDEFLASIGEVELIGEINGYYVSGDAVLKDMKGEFGGMAFHNNYFSSNQDPISFESMGTFAGDDGENAAFAGYWSTR